nr:KAP family NTPase [uncultured Pseudomonas sp.]
MDDYLFMENISRLARQDRAIEYNESDALDRGPFVANLVKALVHVDPKPGESVVASQATGFVVGLTGEWGLGKSSVLNLLKEQLSQIDGVVVASLNPWLFKGRDELVQAYFNSLRDALGKSPSERARALVAPLAKYRAALEFAGSTTAAGIDLFVGAGVVSGWFKKYVLKAFGIFSKPGALSANDERRSLEKKLAGQQLAVVVLIDELDRVEDEEVRAVAQLIKAVGDIKGISYLVAYDTDRVTQALGRGSDFEQRRRSGESYLEKIIQFSIPLRPLMQKDARLLITAALRDSGIHLADPLQPHQTAIFDYLLHVMRTPREIKRLIGAYAVLEEILRDEVCPYDILGYSWLTAKAPGLRHLITVNVEKLVDDPGFTELNRRFQHRQEHQETQEAVGEVLGESAEEFSDLIQLLFPRFSSEASGTPENGPGLRISKRRNLIRLLYLGNPPGMMTRNDIESLWMRDSAVDLVKALILLIHQEKIGGLFDRIGDFLPALPRSGDLTFWPALSRALVRQHDWITGQETNAKLVEDAGAILWRFAHSIPDGRVYVQAIVEALIADGDLLITPWLLRKHLFAHDLTPYRRQSNGDEFYTLSETESLRERELPRYRDAILAGTVLRRVPDTEAIYCLVNSQQWISS